MPANIIYLHYLCPFWEVMRYLQTVSPAETFQTLFTYTNLRTPETDPDFSRIVSVAAQDTLRGYLRLTGRIMVHGCRGRNLLLVHQLDYMGPYALMLLALLFKEPQVSVYGPQGLKRDYLRRDAFRIFRIGLTYFLRRLQAKGYNLVRLRAVKPLDRLRLKRPYPRTDRVPPPKIALIEPTNACNLNCPVCETGNKSLQRKKANMSIEQFRVIVDKLPSCVEEICLHINGESFLNRDIYQMIRYAVDRGFKTLLDTNGLLMKPKEAVQSGLDHITICLDGDDPQSYGKYRIGGDYDRLIENIKGLVSAKKAAGAERPWITLKVIAMQHTQRLVADIAQVAHSMGADDSQIAQFTARTCDQALEFQSEQSEFSKYIPTDLKRGRLTTRYVPNIRECQVPYNAVSITASGDVDPCCRDMNGKHSFGNLLETDFDAIWNGRAAVAFRRMLIEKKPDICQDCQLAVNPTIF